MTRQLGTGQSCDMQGSISHDTTQRNKNRALLQISSFIQITHYHWKPQTCNNCKNVCNIQQEDVIHRNYVIYRGKTKDYMFSEHVIFSTDKLHVKI